MSHHRTFVCSILLVLAAAATVGCNSRLQPDAEAVLYYFRNARVGGEVQRVWPEGQKYVDNVLKADAKLQTELNKLTAWTTPESLPPQDGFLWQDSQALGLAIGDLDKLVSDEAVKEREKAQADLEAAVAAVPASLKLAPADEKGFIDQAWQALSLDGAGVGLDVRSAHQQYTDLVRAELDLLKAVRDAAGELDKTAGGLKFTDAARQEAINKAYADVAAKFQARREQLWHLAEEGIIASRGEQAGKRAERYQMFRRTYLRRQLEAIPKRLVALIERNTGTLNKAEAAAKSGSGDAARVAALKHYIGQLSTQRDALKANVEAILKRSAAAKSEKE